MSDFEVFTANDGQPAIRMTDAAQIVGLKESLANQRAEIQGYKHMQDELMSEIDRHHRDFERIRKALDDWEGNAYDAVRAIRNIVG